MIAVYHQVGNFAIYSDHVDKKLQFDETGCLSWGGGNQVHLLKSSEKAEILAWKQNNVVKFIDGVQVCALEPKWVLCIAC